ncbi:phorbol ester/diacylglycerol-binding protein unc-13-like isoform X2 [Anneissia japonica]|uniref:phorbol ester/diacylglycerol-binding protein unc-13-like isoform X2 n=1 Tax=Anneissia japonica TaxID=1529436 RepID=UPI001425A2B5|nr:phorbol ester/diacylglycerol-binding protein unc-13-like isoform X2 [Anneissia japonica]
MKNGHITGTSNPTGHNVLIDARFELPTGKTSADESKDLQVQEAEEHQNKYKVINDIMDQSISAIKEQPYKSANREFSEEDSDYTSDVNSSPSHHHHHRHLGRYSDDYGAAPGGYYYERDLAYDPRYHDSGSRRNSTEPLSYLSKDNSSDRGRNDYYENDYPHSYDIPPYSVSYNSSPYVDDDPRQSDMHGMGRDYSGYPDDGGDMYASQEKCDSYEKYHDQPYDDFDDPYPEDRYPKGGYPMSDYPSQHHLQHYDDYEDERYPYYSRDDMHSQDIYAREDEYQLSRQHDDPQVYDDQNDYNIRYDWKNEPNPHMHQDNDALSHVDYYNYERSSQDIAPTYQNESYGQDPYAMDLYPKRIQDLGLEKQLQPFSDSLGSIEEPTRSDVESDGSFSKSRFDKGIIPVNDSKQSLGTDSPRSSRMSSPRASRSELHHSQEDCLSQDALEPEEDDFVAKSEAIKNQWSKGMHTIRKSMQTEVGNNLS